jgi:poly-beta-1,6-N-acetyl-D-glucosamine synthase
MQPLSYVLVTSAYNEEQFIGHTIQSVLSQTILPVQWVIVSDGSTDGTDGIVQRAAAEATFIRLVRLTEVHTRNFAAQVHAINAGIRSLATVNYDFIGNLDADVSFGPTYFEQLLNRFGCAPRLGLAGGVIRELDGSTLSAPGRERLRSVPHAVQMFRRDCYQAIGPYRALRHGGPDTVAEVTARMKGWEVEGFPDLIVQHHRFTSSAGGVLLGRFRQGAMDYSLGYDPLFELVKCARRIRQRPFAVGALGRLAAFCWCYVSARRREVPPEFVEFLRAEQRGRLRQYLFAAPQSHTL